LKIIEVRDLVFEYAAEDEEPASEPEQGHSAKATKADKPGKSAKTDNTSKSAKTDKPQAESKPVKPKQRHLALKGINLTIEQGTFTAVLGANGSGKSTLAKLLNGILVPTGGSVIVAGMDTADDAHIYDVRRNIGMVFQNPDNQIVAAIVEDDVAFAPENLGIEPAEIRNRVDEAMKTVGIYEKRLHAPHQLSGGQKQRVAIAGVIAMQPQCIVLDEPTAMLDPVGRREVMATVRRLCEEKGITVILITHYMEEAAQAQRVIVMDDGLIAMDCTPREAFSQVERMKSFGLEVPQVTELSYLLRKSGADLPADLLTEDECAEKLYGLLKGKNGGKGIRAGDETPEDNSHNQKTAVEARNLSYKYSVDTPFEHTALNRVNLKINAGEFIGIIGHTGSGKSTLIEHINGLIKPSDGQILLFDKDIWSKGNDLRGVRFAAGLAFQYPEYQLFEETVRKDIAYGPKNMGLSDEETEQRVLEAARDMGVSEEWLERSPFDLSGGQKRRVALAGVIAMRPKILILDEPTSGLDPRGRDSILSHIARLHENSKGELTVILVTHSMDDIVKYADRIMVMSSGNIELFDRTRRVFSQENADKLDAMGLAMPQMSRLMRGLKARGIDLPADLLTLKEAAEMIAGMM
jgi:energy-coupling factor transport system ATP-binding protein